MNRPSAKLDVKNKIFKSLIPVLVRSSLHGKSIPKRLCTCTCTCSAQKSPKTASTPKPKKRACAYLQPRKSTTGLFSSMNRSSEHVLENRGSQKLPLKKFGESKPVKRREKPRDLINLTIAKPEGRLNNPEVKTPNQREISDDKLNVVEIEKPKAKTSIIKKWKNMIKVAAEKVVRKFTQPRKLKEKII